MKTDKRQILSRVWTGSIAAALVAALAIFIVMLQIEKKVLSEYEKAPIYVAAKEIPKGAAVTELNDQEYLQIVEMDVNLVPESALKSMGQVTDLVAAGKIEAGVPLTEGMFESKNMITAGMKEPVIAGFKAEDLYQVAGGVLRTGDRIHIYMVSETGLTNLVWEDVFVQQVFDSGGNTIKAGDTTSAAQRINVYFDADDVEQLYTELARGTLRVVKVCD